MATTNATGPLALLDANGQHHGIPVLFCTARDQRVVTPRLAALGRPRTELIAKPVDLDALLEAIARGCTGLPRAQRIAMVLNDD